MKMQQMRVDQVDAKTTHKGKNKDGSKGLYKLDLDDESDGTRRLMSIAPGIESALRTGGLLLIDEINRELHISLQNSRTRVQIQTVHSLFSQLIIQNLWVWIC